MIEDIGTVYVAELARRIKSRPFIIGLTFGVLAVFLFVRLPGMIEKTVSGAHSVVLAAPPQLAARAKTLLKDDYTVVATVGPRVITASDLLRYHAQAGIQLDVRARRLHARVLAHDPASVHVRDLQSDLLPLALEVGLGATTATVNSLTDTSVSVETVNSKFSNTRSAEAAHAVAAFLIFALYVLILINSQLVMSSVAEEKTSRIAELLVASVNPIALLSGKILASATLGLMQLAVWLGSAAVASGSAGAAQSVHADPGMNVNMAAAVTPALLVGFIGFFIIGFLQLSLLFAGGASLITRTEDLGAIALPLILPVIAAFMIASITLEAPYSPLSIVSSFIPILSPFVMFTRMALSDVPLVQILLALAINLAALVASALLASRLYRVGMLMYGRTPSLVQIWRVLRT